MREYYNTTLYHWMTERNEFEAESWEYMEYMEMRESEEVEEE